MRRASTTDLYTLFERLHKAGVYPTGGADLGELQHAILFRKPEDTDQAIAVLKKMGIKAERRRSRSRSKPVERSRIAPRPHSGHWLGSFMLHGCWRTTLFFQSDNCQVTVP